MVSANDPIESFFNSINLVKDAFSPLELSIKKAARVFECCLAGSKNRSNAVELATQFSGGDKNGKVQIFGGKKRGGCQNVASFGDEDREKGLAIKFPMMALNGVFLGNAEVLNGGMREKDCAKEDGSCVNYLQFAVSWSLFVNNFVQAFPGPFKIGKKRLQQMTDEDEGCSSSRHQVLGDLKQRQSKSYRLRAIKSGTVLSKQDNEASLECFIGFVFDQFSQSSQKFDMGVNKFDLESHASLEPPPSSHFDLVKAVSALLEGRKADVDGLIGNLKFARVGLGGVPSGVVGVTSSINEDCDDGDTASNSRESAGCSPQKPANDILGIPLSNNVVFVAPAVEISFGSVLRSALAGGFSCALSAAIMHPVDTVKTQVQASTLNFPQIISKLPQIGVRGLYMGSVPAILGQFSSHGLRTGICEVSKFLITIVAPTLPDIQVQSLASFCSTVLGTVARVPCEVLKQRCQAGLNGNAWQALVATWHLDGVKGFFRGTGATLCREVPFYVAGAGLYAESIKGVQKILGRELKPWEIVVVGAISGGLTGVCTTPFDVIKTRMMTAPQGQSVSMSLIAYSILMNEGPLALFRGAVPRFFWIAPLGAMNFAGYELTRKALDRNHERAVAKQLQLRRKEASTGQEFSL